MCGRSIAVDPRVSPCALGRTVRRRATSGRPQTRQPARATGRAPGSPPGPGGVFFTAQRPSHSARPTDLGRDCRRGVAGRSPVVERLAGVASVHSRSAEMSVRAIARTARVRTYPVPAAATSPSIWTTRSAGIREQRPKLPAQVGHLVVGHPAPRRRPRQPLVQPVQHFDGDDQHKLGRRRGRDRRRLRRVQAAAAGSPQGVADRGHGRPGGPQLVGKLAGKGIRRLVRQGRPPDLEPGRLAPADRGGGQPIPDAGQQAEQIEDGGAGGGHCDPQWACTRASSAARAAASTASPVRRAYRASPAPSGPPAAATTKTDRGARPTARPCVRPGVRPAGQSSRVGQPGGTGPPPSGPSSRSYSSRVTR